MRGFVLVAALAVLLNTGCVFTTVPAGHVGVYTRFGGVTGDVVQPGWAWQFPLIDYVVQFDTRVQKEQVDAGAASRDLQEVKASVALNYHLSSEAASDVFQAVGADYRSKVVDPAMQEAFKATTARFTAEELITQREVVKTKVHDLLSERLVPYYVVVDEINIVNFEFSDEFSKAIEEKQVAQQRVERARRDLERVRVEAEQALAQATGQADAQKKLRDAGSLSPEYLNYLAVNKWDGKLPQVTGGAMPFITVPTR